MDNKIYFLLLNKISDLQSKHNVHNVETWFLKIKIYPLRKSLDNKIFHNIILELKKISEKNWFVYYQFSEEAKDFILNQISDDTFKSQLSLLWFFGENAILPDTEEENTTDPDQEIEMIDSLPTARLF